MTLPLPVVLATANPDKVREIVEILETHTGAPLAVHELSADGRVVAVLVDRPGARTSAPPPHLAAAPDVAETGATLEDNARIKARALAAATGLVALADDTGLEVAALGGAPGVHSARYAGPTGSYADNVAKLLAALPDRDCAARAARFVTVALARWPDGREVTARGAVDGHVTRAPRGDRGFGYDPVFVPSEGDGRTFAEMTPTEKHALSHRGRAFRALVAAIDDTG
jgi:XTP/dITP diphosphohydrolase